MEVVSRHGPAGEYRFVINHREEPVALPGTGVDLVSGRRWDGVAEVPAGDVVVLHVMTEGVR